MSLAAFTLSPQGALPFGALNLLNQPLSMLNQPIDSAGYSTGEIPALCPDPNHHLWLHNLSAGERKIYDTAQALYSALTLRGTCYHSSFFLYYYLKHHCGIDGGRVEVGFVNDGTDAQYGSHAWYVHQGRITDVTLCRPFDAQNNWQGPLTILGRDIIPGWKWRYHTETSRHGMQAVRNLFTLPSADDSSVVTAAKRLHVAMSNIARSDEAIRQYLDSAPRGLTYTDLAEKISAPTYAMAA